jgi:hypothetical protein
LALVKDSGPYCTIGIYVTTSRLTKGAWTAIRDARLNQHSITVVVIDYQNLRQVAQRLKTLVPALYEQQTFRSDPD